MEIQKTWQVSILTKAWQFFSELECLRRTIADLNFKYQRFEEPQAETVVLEY